MARRAPEKDQVFAPTRMLVRLMKVFAPPQNATPTQLRLNGLKQLVVGGTLLGICLAIISRALGPNDDEQSPQMKVVGVVLMVPITLAYLLFMGGFYSVLTGHRPGEGVRGALASTARVLLGVTFILVTLVGAFVVWAWL